jgi:hypothetical protein
VLFSLSQGGSMRIFRGLADDGFLDDPLVILPFAILPWICLSDSFSICLTHPATIFYLFGSYGSKQRRYLVVASLAKGLFGAVEAAAAAV